LGFASVYSSCDANTYVARERARPTGPKGNPTGTPSAMPTRETAATCGFPPSATLR